MKRFSKSRENESKKKTDVDILVDNHRFIREENDDDPGEGANETKKWEIQQAKSYYDTLYKNYAIADLSRYGEKKIGLRWRTKSEVDSGKGEKVCGNKTCQEKELLSVYEVPFDYKEKNEREKKVKKKALVSLKLCKECHEKLEIIQGKTEKKEQSEEESEESEKKKSAEASEEKETKRRKKD